MRFINSEPKFQKYSRLTSRGELYYRGQFDQAVAKIFDTLDSGGFPEDLRGNFGFYFRNAHRVVIAVDHLPTVNMFYTSDAVSHIYRSLIETLPKPADTDPVLIKQMRYFWGGTVGADTTFRKIQRVPAGHYLDVDLVKGTSQVRSYVNVWDHRLDSSITRQEIADAMETIIEENTREPVNLLWSSGTDSNSILGFIRKLGRTQDCRLISMFTSDVIWSNEREHCEYLARTYGLEASYFDIGKYIGVTDEVKSRLNDPAFPQVFRDNFYRTWRSFWWEPNVMHKYMALWDNGALDRPTLTGEFGDQLFGSRFSKVFMAFLSQVQEPTLDQISELFLTADSTRFHKVRYQPQKIKHSSDQHKEREQQEYREAWQRAKDWVSESWQRIDTSGDTINKIELLQALYKGSHRCYNYGQMMGTEFRHPFTDYRLFWRVYRTPGEWKIQQGRTRRLSFDIIKDWVDPGPWNWPKSGIAVPMQAVADLNRETEWQEIEMIRAAREKSQTDQDDTGDDIDADEE